MQPKARFGAVTIYEPKIYIMEEKDLLKKIEQWAKESHAYLSSRTPYAKGYKDVLLRKQRK